MFESLFDKVAGLQTCNFIKNRLRHRCFPEKYFQIFKNTGFEEHLRTTVSVPFQFLQEGWRLFTFYWLEIYEDSALPPTLLMFRATNDRFLYIFSEWKNFLKEILNNKSGTYFCLN